MRCRVQRVRENRSLSWGSTSRCYLSHHTLLKDAFHSMCNHFDSSNIKFAIHTVSYQDQRVTPQDSSSSVCFSWHLHSIYMILNSESTIFFSASDLSDRHSSKATQDLSTNFLLQVTPVPSSTAIFTRLLSYHPKPFLKRSTNPSTPPLVGAKLKHRVEPPCQCSQLCLRAYSRSGA